MAGAKLLVAAGNVRATTSAIKGAALLGLNEPEMYQVVLALDMKDFYKSMTTNADHTVWQDVYRPRTEVGELYVKFTVLDGVLVVSFKEK